MASRKLGHNAWSEKEGPVGLQDEAGYLDGVERDRVHYSPRQPCGKGELLQVELDVGKESSQRDQARE
jgi:hypothetical protein